jgi:hypothetical protein
MVGGLPLREARRRSIHPRRLGPPVPHARAAEPRSLRGEEGSRARAVRWHPPSPEYARQGGQIRARSRHLRELSGPGRFAGDEVVGRRRSLSW